jgi:hypothetical protein
VRGAFTWIRFATERTTVLRPSQCWITLLVVPKSASPEMRSMLDNIGDSSITKDSTVVCMLGLANGKDAAFTSTSIPATSCNSALCLRYSQRSCDARDVTPIWMQCFLMRPHVLRLLSWEELPELWTVFWFFARIYSFQKSV